MRNLPKYNPFVNIPELFLSFKLMSQKELLSKTFVISKDKKKRNKVYKIII